MSGALTEYDPKEVKLSWDGVDVTDGIQEGTFITVARVERTSTFSVGADGGTTRVFSGNTTGTVEVTLRAGSATNSALTDRLADEELDPRIPHISALTVEDFSGNDLFTSEFAVLEGWPDSEKADTESDRVWMFLCHNLKPQPRGGGAV